MVKEADFAFKQAFAFCPYSPEAVFRYVNLLLSLQRFDDALVVASTCLKLDPYNGQVVDLVRRLKEWKSQTGGVSPLDQLERTVRENPADFQSVFNLAAQYAQLQQPGRAIELLDGLVANPKADPAAFRAAMQGYSNLGHTAGIQTILVKLEAAQKSNPSNLEVAVTVAEAHRTLRQSDRALPILDQVLGASNLDVGTVLRLAQEYAALANYPRLETTLEKLVKFSPQSPEAWYDFAALKAQLGKNAETFPALSNAFEFSRVRRQSNPGARDLFAEAAKDPRFQAVRLQPEYQKLAGKK